MQKEPVLRILLSLIGFGGGVHGTYLTIRAFFESGRLGLLEFLLFLIALAGYMFISVASLLLFLDPRLLWPMKWALAIQIPWIVLPGFTYKFAAGFCATLVFTMGHRIDRYEAGYRAAWQLGSLFQFNFLTGTGFEVGINAAAACLLAGLLFPARLQERQPAVKSEEAG